MADMSLLLIFRLFMEKVTEHVLRNVLHFEP
jgi:hypothetical protein